MKLVYVICGVLLGFFGFMLLTWSVPIIIGILAIYSAFVFFVYGWFAPSQEKLKAREGSIDKIEDEVMSIWPKVLSAFLSILMFGGSAFLFYSMFYYPWGLAALFPIFGVVIMFILGCLLLYVAIKL